MTNRSGLSSSITAATPGIYRTRSIYPPWTVRVLLLTAAYVAIPWGDIPFLGISLSAPLVFLLALEVYLRPPAPWLSRYRRWILLALWMWAGIFISWVSNGLMSGGTRVDPAGVREVLYFAYWVLIVFPITAHLVAELGAGRQIIQAMAVGVVLTAGLRWYEALAWGKIGAWTSPRLFSQNMYGFLFSTFAPAVLALLVDPNTRRRLWVAAGLLVVWSAAAINGSRGSWVALAAGVPAFLLLYLLVHPKHYRRLIVIIFIFLGFAGLLVLAPEQVVSRVSQRYATFQRLEEDKTFLARQLMVQKGLRLFGQSPLVGVGPARWTREYVPLEIPPRLGGWAREADYQRKSSHNSYVSLLAEAGLAGAIPFGLLLLVLLVRGYQAAMSLSRHHDQFWGLGVYLAFLTMSVHLWVLAGVTGTTTWTIYGMVAGMIETAQRMLT